MQADEARRHHGGERHAQAEQLGDGCVERVGATASATDGEQYPQGDGGQAEPPPQQRGHAVGVEEVLAHHGRRRERECRADGPQRAAGGAVDRLGGWLVGNDGAALCGGSRRVVHVPTLADRTAQAGYPAERARSIAIATAP